MAITDIAGYRVIRQLGAGGMGQVFLVQHPRLPRQDALKLLDAGVSRNADFRARFQREADVLAKLSHPNIVTLHDRGEFEDRLWITMEYVVGTDASQLVKAGPIDLPDALALIEGAGAALDYAWRKEQITHRDVKPANILVGMDGPTDDSRVAAVKLADFGIAKAAGEATSLTSTGVTIGTMQYISPEAIEGAQLDNRADIYSLGCTAFHLLSGQPPYSGPTMTALMSAHLTAPPPRISERAAHLPRSLDPVFARVLAKDPGERFESCAAFVAALRDALEADGSTAVMPPGSVTTVLAPTPQPQTVPNARPRRSPKVALAATVVAVVVLGAAAAGFLLLRDQPASTPAASSTPPLPSTSAISTERLAGTWGRTDVLLTLLDSGGGTYVVSQGASNSQTWSVQWAPTSMTAATVTLVDKLLTEGTVGVTLYSGNQFSFDVLSSGYATLSAGTGDLVVLCPRHDASFTDSTLACGA